MIFSNEPRDAILIQQACGAQQPMLAIAAGHHARYCLDHGFDYWALFGHVRLKSHLIRDGLNAGYRYIVVLDADTLIADPTRDLREACSAHAISCTWHSGIPWPYGCYDHHNIGAMYMERSEWLGDFAEEWGSADLSIHHWGEQHAYNQMTAPKRTIGCEWNSCSLWIHPTPVVMGWHGVGNVQERTGYIEHEMVKHGFS